MPGWKRWMVGWGWDTIFFVFAVPIVVGGVIATIALAIVIAAVASVIRLTGTAEQVLSVAAVGACLATLFVIPTVLYRRLRHAFPAAWFEKPAVPSPVRRSRAAIMADVSRLDARFAPPAEPPSAVGQDAPQQPDR